MTVVIRTLPSVVKSIESLCVQLFLQPEATVQMSMRHACFYWCVPGCRVSRRCGLRWFCLRHRNLMVSRSIGSEFNTPPASLGHVSRPSIQHCERAPETSDRRVMIAGEQTPSARRRLGRKFSAVTVLCSFLLSTSLVL